MPLCHVGPYELTLGLDSADDSEVKVKSIEVSSASDGEFKLLPDLPRDSTIRIDGGYTRFSLTGPDGQCLVDISVKRDKISPHYLDFSFTLLRFDASFSSTNPYDTSPKLELPVGDKRRWLGNKHRKEFLVERSLDKQLLELPLDKQRKFIEKHYRRLHED